MNEDKNMIIVRIGHRVRAETEKKLRKSIEQQRASGLVVLPYFCEVIYCPDDVKIEIQKCGTCCHGLTTSISGSVYCEKYDRMKSKSDSCEADDE